MKKLFLLLFFSLIIIGSVFAESDNNTETIDENDSEYQSHYKRMSVDSSLETSIPFIIDEENSIGLPSKIFYIIFFTSFRVSWQYSLLSFSDYLNLGIGFDVFTNPLSLLSEENFFGGIGLFIYNDFLISDIILSPYVKSGWIYAISEDEYRIRFYSGFLDFSAGVNASYKKYFIDICYNTAVLDLLDDAEEVHFNAQAIRVGLGYTVRY